MIVTPDGRYIIVRGRLWRATNPALAHAEREGLTKLLMSARQAIRAAAPRSPDMRAARRLVQAAKVGLGERGPVWWGDGEPDLNRRLVKNTPYAEWYQKLSDADV